jgi:hypothetical protein
MAMQIAAKCRTTNADCFTTDTIPRIVAIAPGPNMMGIAIGTKATSSSAPFAPTIDAAGGRREIAGTRSSSG